MMEALKKNRNALIFLVLIIAGFLVYKFMWQPEDPLLVSQTSSTAQIIGQDLINELNRLKALSNIDETLFVNPVFVNLKDVEVPVQPKPIGRPNPFMPVGS